MIMSTENAQPKQNMGLVDRVLRLLIGAALIGTAYYFSAYRDVAARLWDVWGSYSTIIAVYPILTGMLGWEPLYALFRVRSCGTSGRNQCGTLPFQIKAMFDHVPKYTESETEHSLESCRDEPMEHPHHKIWRVDEDPILYPDDKDWHGYFARKSIKKGVGRTVNQRPAKVGSR